jgi:hypothetical protein
VANRLAVAFVVSFVVLFASYLVFNLAFWEWTAWRYPHHDSMAVIAALIEGIPVAAVSAIIGFVVAFYRTGRKAPR